MDYTITPVEILHLSLICLVGGGCALGFGLAAPSGHPVAAIVAFVGTAASVSAYAALTHRIMVVRGPRPEEAGPR